MNKKIVQYENGLDFYVEETDKELLDKLEQIGEDGPAMFIDDYGVKKLVPTKHETKPVPTFPKTEIETLKELIDIQCSDGNWNYDPYMHGMANGMILALSLFEGGAPEYLDAPEEWLADKAHEEVLEEDVSAWEDDGGRMDAQSGCSDEDAIVSRFAKETADAIDQMIIDEIIEECQKDNYARAMKGL